MYHLILTLLLAIPMLTTAVEEPLHANQHMLASEPWARATPPGANTAAVYLTLTNTGEQDNLLKSVETPLAERVEIHESSVSQHGVHQMRWHKSLRLPAASTIHFAPGSYHLMLIGLKQPLKDGLEVPLQLDFGEGNFLSVRVPIKPLRYQPN